jgi:hypothetical protein
MSYSGSPAGKRSASFAPERIASVTKRARLKKDWSCSTGLPNDKSVDRRKPTIPRSHVAGSVRNCMIDTHVLSIRRSFSEKLIIATAPRTAILAAWSRIHTKSVLKSPRKSVHRAGAHAILGTKQMGETSTHDDCFDSRFHHVGFVVPYIQAQVLPELLKPPGQSLKNFGKHLCRPCMS